MEFIMSKLLENGSDPRDISHNIWAKKILNRTTTFQTN